MNRTNASFQNNLFNKSIIENELMARRLASMGNSTGADIMVTGCSTCRDIILENIDAERSEGTIEVLDLILFLDRVIQ